MKFLVNIDFRKGPSFSTTVLARDESDAKIAAVVLARQYGFDSIPKKVIVRPEWATDKKDGDAALSSANL